MRSGQFRDYVRFEDRAPPSTAYVSSPEDWQAVEEAFARIEPLGVREGAEREIGDRLAGTEAFEITVRYTPSLAALTASARIVEIIDGLDAKVFNVRLIADPDRRKERLVFTVDTGRPGEG